MRFGARRKEWSVRHILYQWNRTRTKAKAAPPRIRMALTGFAIGALRKTQQLPERATKYFGQNNARFAV
jgi:hypothetical protein